MTLPDPADDEEHRRVMDTALTLTNDMKLVLGLVGFTMAMFLFERIRADVVALVVLVVLGLTGLVAPEELFGGFSGNAVMSIIATMILGAGLDRTGALNRLATWLLRRGAWRRTAPADDDQRHRRAQFQLHAEPVGDGACTCRSPRACPRAPACRCSACCCRSPRPSSWAAR